MKGKDAALPGKNRSLVGKHNIFEKARLEIQVPTILTTHGILLGAC